MTILGFAHLTYSACADLAERFSGEPHTIFRRVPNMIEKRAFLGQEALVHDILLIGKNKQVELVFYDDARGLCEVCSETLTVLEDHFSGRHRHARLSVSSMQFSTFEAVGLTKNLQHTFVPGLPGKAGLEVVLGSASQCVAGEKHGLAGIAFYVQSGTNKGIKLRLAREGFLLSSIFSIDIGANRFSILLGARDQLNFEFLSRFN